MYQVSPQLAGATAVIVPTIIGIGTALGSFLRSLSKAAQNQVPVFFGKSEFLFTNRNMDKSRLHWFYITNYLFPIQLTKDDNNK